MEGVLGLDIRQLVWHCYVFVRKGRICVTVTQICFLKYFHFWLEGSPWAIPRRSYVRGWWSERVHNLETRDISIYCSTGKMVLLVLPFLFISFFESFCCCNSYPAYIIRFTYFSTFGSIYKTYFLLSLNYGLPRSAFLHQSGLYRVHRVLQ